MCFSLSHLGNIWKQVFSGVSRIAKSPHKPLQRYLIFFSFKLFLKTLAKIRTSTSWAAHTRWFLAILVMILLHYFHMPWLSIGKHPSSLVSQQDCKSEEEGSHLFVVRHTVKLSYATAWIWGSQALWQHCDRCTSDSSTNDWSRKQLVFRSHGLFRPDLFKKEKQKKKKKKE